MAKLPLAVITGDANFSINQNFQAIEAFFDTLLSRDGATPNQMIADLDMNSNFIINVPDPEYNYHAVNKRYVDGIVLDAEAALASGALLRLNNLDDLDDVGTARTNLGLGSMALADTGDYTDTAALTILLAGKSDTGHTHIIGDVTGLQSSLDGKAPVSHVHTIANVTGLQTALDGKQPVGSYAAAVHIHAIADVTGLQTALDGKSDTGHSHIIGDITGLQTALDGKAASVHTHAISDVTGLQTALDGKSATGHGHAISDVTGLQTALDGKSATGHTHVIADITDANDANWDTAFGWGDHAAAGYAAGSHTHVIADITDANDTNWDTAYGWGDHGAAGYALTSAIANVANWDTAFGWGDHASGGYADGTNEANWDTAFGWGDHASGGYLASSSYTAADVLSKLLTVDGAGSGLDADLLQGYGLTTAATGDTVVLRESDGDINGRYVFGTYMNMSHSASTRSSDTVFYSSTDNFIRKNNASGFRTSLDVPGLATNNTFSALQTFTPATDGGDVVRWRTSGGRFTTLTAPLHANGSDPWVWQTGNAFSWVVDSNQVLELDSGGRVIVGDSTRTSAMRIYMATGYANHAEFYSGTTRVGEIGASDTTWLRINENTSKNIYTPRYIRADNGFFVGGSVVGITGAGRFHSIGGSIGNPSHSFKNDKDTGMYRHASNSIGFTTGGTLRGYWNSTSLYAQEVTLTSDIAIKEDIEDIPYGLDTIMQLQPKRYKRKDTGRTEIGFVAQDMQKVIPELVPAVAEDELLGITYPKLTAALVKAVQELKQEVEELKHGGNCTCIPK